MITDWTALLDYFYLTPAVVARIEVERRTVPGVGVYWHPHVYLTDCDEFERLSAGPKASLGTSSTGRVCWRSGATFYFEVA